MMTKKDKKKLKELRDDLKYATKKYDKLQDFAASSLDSISNPPDHDDLMNAESLVGDLTIMEELNQEIESLEEEINDILYKYKQEVA